MERHFASREPVQAGHNKPPIRINRQYRICFAWENGDAYDVEITDYH